MAPHIALGLVQEEGNGRQQSDEENLRSSLIDGREESEYGPSMLSYHRIPLAGLPNIFNPIL